MNLQEIFYTLAIAYFVSSWIVFICVLVIAAVLYKKVQRLGIGMRSFTRSLPVFSLIFPLIQGLLRRRRR